MHRLLTSLRWMVAVCALLVVLGSCDFRTSRTFTRESGTFEGAGAAMSEGAAHWAGWTFLLGGVAVVALLLWVWIWGGWPFFAAVALALFAAAAIAGDHWRDLRTEESYYDLLRDQDYFLTTALGPPLVTITGAVGGFLALLTIAVSFVVDREKPGDTAGVPPSLAATRRDLTEKPRSNGW